MRNFKKNIIPRCLGGALFWSLIAAMCWLSLWGCSSMPPLPPSRTLQASQLPEVDTLQAFVQRRGGEYFDAELVAGIRQLGQELADNSQRPDLAYRFTVLDRTEPELHVFPGGQILMTRGLLTRSSDARQLSNLLAFAIADAASAPSAGQHQLNLDLFRARPGQSSETATAAAANRAQLDALLDGLQQNRYGYELYESARRREAAGDLSGAISGYLQAATAAPDQPQILTGLGLAYLLAGDPRSARVHLQNAIRLQHAYYLSRMGLGYVDLQLARYADAIAELEKSVQLLPVARNQFLLAESYEKNGRPEDAVPLYRAVVRADEHGKLGRTAAQRLQQLEN
jgi:predicted Zn-dependent protease